MPAVGSSRQATCPRAAVNRVALAIGCSFTSADVIDSAASSTSTNTPLDLRGWIIGTRSVSRCRRSGHAGHPHRPTTTGAQAASAIIATSAAIATANRRRRAMFGSLLKARQAICGYPSRHRLNGNNEIRSATVSTRDAAGSEI
jgi:hypothetical protein